MRLKQKQPNFLPSFNVKTIKEGRKFGFNIITLKEGRKFGYDVKNVLNVFV